MRVTHRIFLVLIEALGGVTLKPGDAEKHHRRQSLGGSWRCLWVRAVCFIFFLVGKFGFPHHHVRSQFVDARHVDVFFGECIIMYL